jgi:hypothetical protein
MRKGIGVGKNIKLPRGYRPESRDPRKNFYCGESSRAPSGKQKGNPFECFRKGFGIGKQLQYGRKKYRSREDFGEDRKNFEESFGEDFIEDKKEDFNERYGEDFKEDSKEDFMDEIPISKALFIAFLVTLVVFGILFMINVSWMWALIIGFISGALFWYFCSD